MRATTSIVLGVAVAVAVSMGAAASLSGCGESACLGSSDGFGCESPDGGGTGDASTDSPGFVDSPNFTASCTQTTVSVGFDAHTPTVDCSASATVNWGVDRGEIGSMSNAGKTTASTFVPTGTTGGVVTVIASSGQTKVPIPILVQLNGSSNGTCPNSQIASNVTQLTQGGGIGGVGGEGCGGAVTDLATSNALDNPSTDGSMKFLYPYDKTVWPRGLLATNLMWDWSVGDADAIKIQLTTTSGSFSWTGKYARPTILGQTGGNFIRHPIPQNVWEMATNTAGTVIKNERDRLTVTLVIAKNGQGYGPITETWDVAPGRMNGTAYYQSYNTEYVTNAKGPNPLDGGTLYYGAATLGIKHGATAPFVVAGTTKTETEIDQSQAGCRVCHSASADGSTLISQHGESSFASSSYALKTNDTETALSPSDGRFAFAGLYPDGSFIFSNAAYIAYGTSNAPSALYALPSGTPITSTGLPSGLQAGMPVFSPDGKHVAFNYYGGTSNADQRSLATMDFDLSTKTFSNFKTVYTPPSGTAVWPSYMPTSDSVVFELELAPSDNGEFANTMAHCFGTGPCGDDGAHGEIWWLDLATSKTARLDALVGTGYLPTGPNSHGNDQTLDYEPSVISVTAGGYAWVAFTSRRLYGSVATTNPFWSDPRYHDLSKPNTKKLWVAAIDLNAAPGTDASHPAFYLPAQELLAGNSRGYWVVDPCESDGLSCESGDQCCGGYCASEDGGAPVCGSNVNTCAGAGDKCSNDADAGIACCPGLQCYGGYCGIPTPPN